MKYAVESRSGAMIYVPNLIKIGSGIQKLIRGIHRQRQQSGLISLLLFFQKKENRLKMARMGFEPAILVFNGAKTFRAPDRPRPRGHCNRSIKD
jgi:hypothetical protein